MNKHTIKYKRGPVRFKPYNIEPITIYNLLHFQLIIKFNYLITLDY